jgi:hypothetical protein
VTAPTNGAETDQPTNGSTIDITWEGETGAHRVTLVEIGGCLVAFGLGGDSKAFGPLDFVAQGDDKDEWAWPSDHLRGGAQVKIQLTPAAVDLADEILLGRRVFKGDDNEIVTFGNSLSQAKKAQLISMIIVELNAAYTVSHVAKIKVKLNERRKQTTTTIQTNTHT